MEFDSAFFDAGIDRNGTACEKWDDRAVVGENVVPLWVADMDFRSAPAISEALAGRAAHACYGYTMVVPEDTQAMPLDERFVYLPPKLSVGLIAVVFAINIVFVYLALLYLSIQFPDEFHIVFPCELLVFDEILEHLVLLEL